MTISILRWMLGALLAGLLIGCDVAPSTPNSTTGPAAQPTIVMTSQPGSNQGGAYPPPTSAANYPPPGPATAYPAPAQQAEPTAAAGPTANP
jgi:hypothetical protein